MLLVRQQPQALPRNPASTHCRRLLHAQHAINIGSIVFSSVAAVQCECVAGAQLLLLPR